MTPNKIDVGKLLSHPLWFTLVVFSVWLGLYVAVKFFAAEKFTAQLALSRVFVLVLAGGLLFLTARNRSGLFFEKVSPYTIATFRIVFYGFVSIGFTAPLYLFDIAAVDFPWAEIPVSHRVPLPFMEWYVMHVPVSPLAVTVAVKLIAISAFACMIGFGFGWFSVVFLLATFYLNGFQNFFGKVNHNHFIIWFSFLFCFSRGGDVLSVDNWLRNKRGINPLPKNDGLVINYAIMLIGIIYFFPGFHKVWTSGLDWALTDNLRNQLYWKWYELNDWRPIFSMDKFPILYKLAGLFTVIFELCFLFFVFDKRTRVIAIVMGISFHLFTYLFMHINFLYLVLCYIALFDWSCLTGKHPKEVSSSQKSATNPLLLYAGVALVAANCIAGILKINSYPIACFPTFENLVSDSTETLVYKTSSTKELTRQKMLDKFTPYIFRQWEFSLLQEVNSNNGTAFHTKAANLSQRVTMTFPELNQTDTLKMYLRKLRLTAFDFVPLQTDSLIYLHPLSQPYDP